MPTAIRAGRSIDWAAAQRINALVFIALALLGLTFGQQRFRFLISTGVYTLCCGNLTFLVAPPLFAKFRKYDLTQVVILLIGAGLVLAAIGSALGAIILSLLRAFPGSSLAEEFIGGIRIASIVNPIVLIVLYLYESTRAALEGRAVELEKAVESGTARLRQQDEELQKAREIQQGLLPKEIPQVRGYHVAGAWQPALAVGGDYYDVIGFGQHGLGLAIADVVGKGITAALLMANLQAAVRAYASEMAEPRMVCDRINAVICSNIALGKFITFFYGVLDAERHTLTYCNAGHNPPILIRGSDSIIRLDRGGALLGVFPKWDFEQAAIDLMPGDRVVLYTDGVTEAENSAAEEFGEERLEQLVRKYAASSAEDIQSRVLEAVSSFCGGNFRDDATLLVIAAR